MGWTEKRLQRRVTTTTDSLLGVVVTVTGEVGESIVIVQHTEDKDLVAEAVIAPDETVPDLRDGGPDHVIAAHGLEIEGHVTGGPDLGQEDVHVPPEEDQGTGNGHKFLVIMSFW